MCCCFVQRRENIEAKISDPSELLLFGHVFLLMDVLASVTGLGKREFGALSVLFVVLKQPRRRRCNSEETLFGLDRSLDRSQLIL